MWSLSAHFRTICYQKRFAASFPPSRLWWLGTSWRSHIHFLLAMALNVFFTLRSIVCISFVIARRAFFPVWHALFLTNDPRVFRFYAIFRHFPHACIHVLPCSGSPGGQCARCDGCQIPTNKNVRGSSSFQDLCNNKMHRSLWFLVLRNEKVRMSWIFLDLWYWQLLGCHDALSRSQKQISGFHDALSLSQKQISGCHEALSPSQKKIGMHSWVRFQPILSIDNWCTACLPWRASLPNQICTACLPWGASLMNRMDHCQNLLYCFLSGSQSCSRPDRCPRVLFKGLGAIRCSTWGMKSPCPLILMHCMGLHVDQVTSPLSVLSQSRDYTLWILIFPTLVSLGTPMSKV